MLLILSKLSRKNNKIPFRFIHRNCFLTIRKQLKPFNRDKIGQHLGVKKELKIPVLILIVCLNDTFCRSADFFFSESSVTTKVITGLDLLL